MDCIERFLQDMHFDIKRDYNRSEDGKWRDCRKIAKDIKMMLEKDGAQAYILRIEGSLRPLLFPGVEWGMHYVACTLEDAYDPLVGRPIEVRQYLKNAFEEVSDLEVVVDSG